MPCPIDVLQPRAGTPIQRRSAYRAGWAGKLWQIADPPGLQELPEFRAK